MNHQGRNSLGVLSARLAATVIVLAEMLFASPFQHALADDPMVLQSITVAAQNGALIYGTAGSATFTVTLSTNSGTIASSTLTVTGLPAGANGDFAPNPVSCSVSRCSVTSTLTVSTSSTTPAVTPQAFLVHASGSAVTGSGSLTIGKIPLTVTAVADSKTYDGTTSSTGIPLLTSGTLQNSDTPNWVQTFDNKHIGSNKTLTPSGTVNDANGGNNYAVTFVQDTSGSITPHAITVTASASTKTYDRTTASSATPLITSGSIQGTDLPAFTQVYDNPNVGASKTLTPSGTVNDGNGGNNYLITLLPATTGEITPASASVTPSAASKVYGASDPALGGTLSGFIAGDGITAAYQRIAGETVTGGPYTISAVLSPASALSNYNITYNTANLTITSKSITVSGLTASDKVYDSTTSASITGTASLVGVINADNVNLNTSGATAAFVDKNVATGKVVNVTGYSLTGPAEGNYTLTQPTVLSAAITPATLTLSGIMANSKVYDRLATTSLSGTAALSGIFSGDTVTPGGTPIGNFADKTVGNGRPVSVSGYTLTGTDAGNYTLTLPTNLTANITPAALTVSGLTANAKPYDGTTTVTLTGTAALSGLIAGDIVTLGGTASASFADKAAGIGKPVTVTGYTVSGGDAGNYAFTQPAGLTASITPKPLTITGLVATNKIYDGTMTAPITGTGAPSGVISPDVVTLSGTPMGTFADKNVGTAKPITVTGYSLGGADAANYSLPAQSAGLAANITPKALTIASGLTANNKQYNGTTAATLTTTPPLVFGGLVTGDIVTLVNTLATGTFIDKNVGTAKAVSASGFSLSGTDAGNYALTQPIALTANITSRPLSATATADSKQYDGTRNATAHLTTNKIATDTVTALYTSALFADKAAGNNKTVAVSGISLTGTDAGNYTLGNTSATATATINQAPLTVTAKNASKLFGKTLSFHGTEFTASATVTGDWVSNVSLTSEGQSAEAAVGTYPIVPSDATGNGLSNYAINYVNGTLTVKAAAPSFAPSFTSWNFQVVKVATSSPSVVLTIRNSGGTDLVFGTVTLAGTNPYQFALSSNTCAGARVAPGGSCSVRVAFRPSAAGTRSASIRFTDNAPNSPQSVTLSGKGGVELATNGGFNLYPNATAMIPSNWLASGFTASDGKDTALRQEGTASIRIGNTSARIKTLTQTRSLTGGTAGNTLQLSVWAKGQSIPTTAGLVRVQVQLYNGTTPLPVKFIGIPTGTYPFGTPKKLIFTAPGSYNKVVITLIYSKASGAVWFDGLSLLRAP